MTYHHDRIMAKVHSGLLNNFKDEIRRIQRTFLNYAGLVPYAKRLKRVDSICRRDRDLIRGHGKANFLWS